MMDEIAQLLENFDTTHQPSDKFLNVVSRLKAYYFVFHSHSPYAEVRASVPNTNDPNLPVDTFRAWFLGISFCVLFASLNQVLLNVGFLIMQFFSLRWPRLSFDAVCIQVLSYPCGKALERFLPTRKFHLFGYSFSKRN